MADNDDRNDDTIQQNFPGTNAHLTDSFEPDDVVNTVPADHPVTDSNQDMTEAYDEGRDGAAEASDPLHNAST